MAEHNVLFSLPELEVGKVDATIVIKKDDMKLGELRISKGGLDYYANKRKTAITVSWTELDGLLKEFEKR